MSIFGVLRCVSGRMLLLALGLCVLSRPALADELRIDSCDPPLVQAGEIVLLSLSGSLPGGELTVEFFPQRITVLSAYPVDRRTLAVQVSIPLDAPAGSYNILVYNERGEEALGKELFEVQRKVRVPKISSASPAEVDAALSEVKLTLHCDILDADALSHLSVEWTSEGRPQAGIAGSFSRGGVNSINLTLGGSAGPGVALGRVFFDSTPIYLIKLTRVSSDWSLFGHRPARLVADAPVAEITLIGTELSGTALSGALARLNSGEQRSIEAPLDCVDSSRALARFSPPPPPGEYELEVEQSGVVLYQGPLTILPGRSSTAAPASQLVADADSKAAAVERPSVRPTDSGNRSQLPQWQEALALPEEPEQQPAPEVAEEPVLEEQEAMPEPEAQIEPQPDSQAAMRVQAIPAVIDSSKAVFRVELEGYAPEHPDLERIQASLGHGEHEAQLIFMGLGEERLVLLFSAPDGGWQSGALYELRLLRREDGQSLLRLELPVDGP